MNYRTRAVVVGPVLWVLRMLVQFGQWLTDASDRAWHRLRWWREAPRRGALETRHPPYAHEVVTLPGGVIHDYSRPLAEDEGWNVEGDPLEGLAEDLPTNRA